MRGYPIEKCNFGQTTLGRRHTMPPRLNHRRKKVDKIKTVMKKEKKNDSYESYDIKIT